MPDKVEPKLLDKIYETNARRPKQKEEKGSKKVSCNTVETYNIINGISKNMQANPSSMLTSLHIMQITLSQYAWEALGKGIGASKTLHTLAINLCDVNRDALMAIC